VHRERLAAALARPAAGRPAALAFWVGALSFAVVAVILAASDSGVLAPPLGAASVAAVIGMMRTWGVAYAVPAAMGPLLAFDWFQFPPTHEAAFPAVGDLVDLLVYLSVAAS
jgi:hypothetical protein